MCPHLDDVQGLVDRGLSVEGEAGVDLGGDLARDDLENLLAELDKEAVEGGVDLLINGAAVLLGVVDSLIDQLCVLGLLGRGQDERRVGRCILRLVLVDGGKVAGVADDRLVGGRSARPSHCFGPARGMAGHTHGAGGLQLVERGTHCGGQMDKRNLNPM